MRPRRIRIRLTLDEAALRARVRVSTVEKALDSGDLRSLEPAHIDAWRRANCAVRIVRSVKPMPPDQAQQHVEGIASRAEATR